jgi:hypothetical protein
MTARSRFSRLNTAICMVPRGALVLRSIFVCSIALSAISAPASFAAEKNTLQKNTPVATQTDKIASQIHAPATLSAITADQTTVNIWVPVWFTLQGSGYCKVSVAFGNGLVFTQEGDLPFKLTQSAAYTTNSYETNRIYTATATPTGNCKLGIGKSGSININVVNPAPQGVTPAQPPQPQIVLPKGGTILVKPDDGRKP